MCTGTQKTTFGYDHLGRQHAICKYFGDGAEDYIQEVKEFDLLGRVIEEKELDAQGTVLRKTGYRFNEEGHCCQLLKESVDGVQITSTEFDFLGRVTKVIDPEGHVTVTAYFDNFINALGQRVAYEEVTDAEGNLTCILKDALGRATQVEKKNRMGAVLQVGKLL